MDAQRRLQEILAELSAKKYQSIYAAATDIKSFQVDISSTRRKRSFKSHAKSSRLQALTPAEEDGLVRWITQLTIGEYMPHHPLRREMAEVIFDERAFYQ